MNNTSTIGYLKPCATFDKTFVGKVAEIFHALEFSKSLMAVVYLVEKDNFLRCNKSFIKVLNTDWDRLREEGWKYWFSLISSKEVSKIQYEISNFFATSIADDSLALKYTITTPNNKVMFLEHELLLYTLEDRLLAINYFFDITSKGKRSQNKFVAPLTFEKYKLPKYNQSITNREMEVLELIAEGFSSKQIAEKLYISNHTAITHRKNLIEKFNVRNTAHLIKRTSKLDYV